MNWLKNIIKNALREVIGEKGIDCVKRSTEHIVLDPNLVNVLSIDVGQMPSVKAREYLEKIALKFKDYYPTYKIILLDKRS